MCLYPKLIKNPKYKPNKTNGWKPPKVKDPRTRLIPMKCGKCAECMKQRKNEWMIRLMEELKTNRNGYFITLSFSEESLNKLDKEVQKENRKTHEELNKERFKKTEYIEITGYELENKIATKAIRKYLDRVRKETGIYLRHWMVTELGQENTERIHLHGIIWTDEPIKVLNKWKYGNVWVGNYVNETTISYIVKYINKTDQKHKEYNPIILCSRGIGREYINKYDSRKNTYNAQDTITTYENRQGYKIGLPTYYKRKLYTDEEREQLWINLLNKQERWVMGIKTDISKGDEDYKELLKHARSINKTLGYGNDEKNWNQKEYERQQRNIKRWTRQQKQKDL